MVKIPKRDPLYDALESGLITDEPRSYLGYSLLGHECQRYVWYSFRWAFVNRYSKKTARIFERGHLEEPRVIRDLEKAGMLVCNTQRSIVDNTGHIKGHVDGVVTNVPSAGKTKHLLEIKTMKNAKFNQSKKELLKIAFKPYWVQIQMYMGSLNLKRCLFVITNKDTEERTYTRHEFCKITFNDYRRIALDIVINEDLPSKIGNKTWHTCKMCSAAHVCQNGIKPKNNCRTCTYSIVELEGKWLCGATIESGKTELSVEDQKEGCKHHFLLDSLRG